MRKYTPLSPGTVFERLTVLGPAAVDSPHGHVLCQCVCGQTTIVRSTLLRSGNTKSCGCIRRRKPWPTKLSYPERCILQKLLLFPFVLMPHCDDDQHICNRLMARGLVEYTEEGFCGYVITQEGRKAHGPL